MTTKNNALDFFESASTKPVDINGLIRTTDNCLQQLEPLGTTISNRATQTSLISRVQSLGYLYHRALDIGHTVAKYGCAFSSDAESLCESYLVCANNRSHSSYNLGRFIADMRELAGMAEGEVKAMSELVQEVREGLKEIASSLETEVPAKTISETSGLSSSARERKRWSFFIWPSIYLARRTKSLKKKANNTAIAELGQVRPTIDDTHSVRVTPITSPLPTASDPTTPAPGPVLNFALASTTADGSRPATHHFESHQSLIQQLNHLLSSFSSLSDILGDFIWWWAEMDRTLAILETKLNTRQEESGHWREQSRGRDPRPKHLSAAKKSGWVVVKALFLDYQSATERMKERYPSPGSRGRSNHNGTGVKAKLGARWKPIVACLKDLFVE